MPRLRQVPRAEVETDFILSMYDRLFGPDRDPVADPGTATGTPGDWWTVFALVPDVFKHAIDGFALYRSDARRLGPALRELAQTRAGYVKASQFVYSQHCKAARNAGLTEEQVAAIPGWQVATCFDAQQRAVLAFADAILLEDGRVGDQVFAAVREFLDEESVLELTYITALYGMHAVMCRALRLEYDDRPDPIVEVPAPAGGAAGFDIGSAISLGDG
jgi:alkylhydroperoxidase family enzyme